MLYKYVFTEFHLQLSTDVLQKDEYQYFFCLKFFTDFNWRKKVCLPLNVSQILPCSLHLPATLIPYLGVSPSSHYTASLLTTGSLHLPATLIYPSTSGSVPTKIYPV